MQRSVLQLKQALDGEINQHTQTNCNMMEDNLKIIDEINKQREANRLLKQAVQAHLGKIRHLAQSQLESQKKNQRDAPAAQMFPGPLGAPLRESNTPFTDRPFTTPTTENNYLEIDPLFLLEKNRLRIAALRAAIGELESRVNMQKSYSREVLPPMDGVVPESLDNSLRPVSEGNNNAHIGIADMYTNADRLLA